MLIPRIGTVRWVNEDGDDLGLWDEGSCSFRSFLRMKIVGTFFKEKVGGGIGRSGEEIHVPVNSFVIIVPIEELNFFESFWAREITDDRRMHQKK